MKKILLFILLIFVFTFKVSALTCTDSYEVTYNANKGKIKISKECVSDKLTNVKPTRKGYAFLGWSVSKTSSVPEYKAGDKIELTDKVTLYAVWSKGIKLTFNANGGKTSKKYKTVYKYLSYGTLPKASKKGYAFTGWYTKKTGGTLIKDVNIVNYSKKFTLYAHYQKINYNLIYELNGGVNNSKNKSIYTITTASFSLSNPSKKGYIFKGWYTTNKYKTKVTKIKKGSTGNKTLYAKWTPITYHVSFNGNGNTSGKMVSQKNIKYGVSFKLKTNTFNKKDYVFAGWNTKKDGSGTSYNDSQNVINLLSINNKTITLYAQWKKPEYKIIYELNDGVNKENVVNTYSSENTTILPSPTKEGFTFDGWFLENNFINKITSIEKGTKGDIKIYAKWTKIEDELVFYTITYELNGGVNPETVVTTFTKNDEIILVEPIRENYKFLGWYTDSELTNKITKINKGTKENIIVYAKWEQNEEIKTYGIAYILNGGVNPSDTPLEYVSTYSVILPTPTREGYTFDGWYTEKEFENKVTVISIGSVGNKTFYAKWIKNSEELIEYNIKYELDGANELLNPVVKYTIEDEVTLLIPSKEGYIFDGWYTEQDFKNKIIKIEKGHTGDITIYAKWIKIENENNDFIITYNLYGGVNPENAINTFKETDEFELLIPTKNGYTFDGWYTDSGFKNKITKINKGTNNNIDLYAKWKFITKRNYNYVYYKNIDSYIISNQDEIIQSIYTGLNSGNDKITLDCNYETVEACLDDFKTVFQNNKLMLSISNYVNPYNKYYNINASYTYSSKEANIELTFNKKYTKEQIEEIDKIIDSNLNELNLNEMSDEEKIKWAHDYLVNKNSYDEESMNTGVGDAYNAYGAIVLNKAVCQGYAEAMALFLDRFNIPNILVPSDTHVWNLVYVNNKWLHLDVTWDDPVVIGGGEMLRYDYYLITNDDLSKLDGTNNHTYNSDYYLETVLN